MIRKIIIKRTLTYFFIFLLFISCKKENAFDCFKSNGKEITETRYPGDFTSIEVYDKIDVVIGPGAEYKVEITAGEHIIKNIASKVKDKVLKLDNNNKCNFVRGYKKKIKVKITTPYVTQVTNFGVGPITFAEDFQQDKIFIKAENSGDTYINGSFDEVRTSSHGNGDMYFKGSSKRLMIYSNGTNYTHAEDFKVSDYIFISTYSIGDTFFNLEGLNTIEYLIWSNGNIYYKGHAGTMRNLSETSAKGKAIPKD